MAQPASTDIPRGLEASVLIAAPTGRDAALTSALLHQVGIPCETAATAEEISQLVKETTVGVLLLTEEAVAETGPRGLREALDAQPAWSEVPVVLFVDGHRRPDDLLRMLDAFGPGASVTVLERPVRPPTLVSVLRAALQARRRQYEVRDLLAQLRDLNATLEDRVEERTAEVRGLASALTLAEQRERNRLSDLLHDHLQQILFAAQLKLKLKEQTNQDELTDQALALLDEAQETVRTLSVELHPPVLEEDGLAVALEWIASFMRERYGLRVEVIASGPCPLPSRELQILLTQSAKELLFNVVKHAETDHARITIERGPRRIRVRVSDEGVGFAPPTGRFEHGHGLRSVTERLQLLGGSFHAESQPGHGATFTMEVPLDNAAPGSGG